MNKPSFEIEINAGKGGVGKSTVSAAKALFSALKQNKKTLMVDMDGGKALARVIQLDNYNTNTITETGINNLGFASIQSPAYLKSRREMDSFKTYMAQFPGDYGLVAFNDMVNEFFGVFTDVEGLHKFISLVHILQEAKDSYEAVIVDVEPTTGLGKLINSTEKIARSIQNLSDTGWGKLQMIGAFWPDIKAYLTTEYMQNAATYMKRLLDVRNMILTAKFSIVTIPEPEPIAQIHDVTVLVDSIKAHLGEVIFNNIGRGDTHVENNLMDKLQQDMQDKYIKFKKVLHNPHMLTGKDRINILTEMGGSIVNQ